MGGGAAEARSGRLRALGLWSASALAIAALAVSGFLMWRSLQADKAISLVARSAMPARADPVLAPLPEVASAQDVAAALTAPAAGPAALHGDAEQGAPAAAAPALPSAVQAATPPVGLAAQAAPPAGLAEQNTARPAELAEQGAARPALAAAVRPEAVAPQAGAKRPAARARVALARPGSQARAPLTRATARGKGSVAGKSAALRRVKAAPAVRKPLETSVQRGLALCKEKAGEAAAACFARACRSYARNAPICLNDEPVRRR
ncbi:hypothetical protein ASC94_06650 [Massilia sp. Root418]|nr:hypothetical protein ASC94_06650 [Massilia sp. Root418]